MCRNKKVDTHRIYVHEYHPIKTKSWEINTSWQCIMNATMTISEEIIEYNSDSMSICHYSVSQLIMVDGSNPNFFHKQNFNLFESSFVTVTKNNP